MNEMVHFSEEIKERKIEDLGIKNKCSALVFVEGGNTKKGQNLNYTNFEYNEP